MITQKYLKECLSYDHESGVFIWLERPLHHFPSVRSFNAINSRQKGEIAGTIHKSNPLSSPYLIISISNSRFRAHNLAWLYVNGYMPSGELDHIDGDTLNNRILNLRDVSRSENNKNRSIPSNNSSGVIGVNWDKRTSKWVAGIKIDGNRIFLGRFSDISDAAIARKEAEKKYGFHDNHGRKICYR